MSDGNNDLAVSGRLDQGTRDAVAAAPAGRNVHEPFVPGEFEAPDLRVAPPVIDDAPTTDAYASGTMTPSGDAGAGSAGAMPAEKGVFGQFEAGEFQAPEQGGELPVIDDIATVDPYAPDGLDAGNAPEGADAMPAERGVFGEFDVGQFHAPEIETPTPDISESPEVLVSPTGTASDTIFDSEFRDEFLSGNPEVFEFAGQNVEGSPDILGFDPENSFADLPEDDAMVAPHADHSLPDIDTKADELDAFMDLFFVDSEEDAMVVDELTGFETSDWDGGDFL